MYGYEIIFKIRFFSQKLKGFYESSLKDFFEFPVPEFLANYVSSFLNFLLECKSCLPVSQQRKIAREILE
jgi:hypothetical protein